MTSPGLGKTMIGLTKTTDIDDWLADQRLFHHWKQGTYGDLHSPIGGFIISFSNDVSPWENCIGIMWHKNPGIGLGHLAVSGGTTVGFKHQWVMNLGLSQDGIYYIVPVDLSYCN